MPIGKMVSLRITDTGEFLDIKNARVVYSLQAFDLMDLVVRKGEFSIDFNMPDIPANRTKLNFATEDFLDANTTYKNIDVELLQNGELVKAGFLRIIGRSEGNIAATFFSGASDWITLLEGSIRDVDLSDFDHTFGTLDIEAGLIKTDEYVYPLIDYGVWADTLGVTGDRVSLFDLRPAVYVRDLLIIMFREIGWKLDGEVMDDIWFKRLIIPFSNSEFDHKAPWAADRALNTIKTVSQTKVGALDNITFPLENINPDNWNGTDTYSADTTMRVEIRASCTYSAATTSPVLEIHVGGVAVATTTITGVGTFTVSITQIIDTSSPFDIIIKMNGPGGTWTITQGKLLIIPSSEILTPAALDFEFSSMLPDITKQELMKYIFIHRMIVPKTDNFSKTLTLSFFKSIDSNSQDNWTEKIDGEKEVKFARLFERYGQNTKFQYLTSDDEKLKEYEIANGDKFGDGKIIIDNDFLETDVDLYDAPFAGTINYDALGGRGYLPFIQFSSNGTDFDEVQDPTFRVLYVIPNVDITFFVADGSIFFTEVGEKTVATFAFFATRNLAFPGVLPKTGVGIDEGLAFDTPNDTSIYSVGLIDRYMDKLERILQNGKIETFKVRLTEIDVREYDITKPVFITQVGGGKLYYKNKLRNFEDTKTSQDVELIPFE